MSSSCCCRWRGPCHVRVSSQRRPVDEEGRHAAAPANLGAAGPGLGAHLPPASREACRHQGAELRICSRAAAPVLCTDGSSSDDGRRRGGPSCTCARRWNGRLWSMRCRRGLRWCGSPLSAHTIRAAVCSDVDRAARELCCVRDDGMFTNAFTLCCCHTDVHDFVLANEALLLQVRSLRSTRA